MIALIGGYDLYNLMRSRGIASDARRVGPVGGIGRVQHFVGQVECHRGWEASPLFHEMEKGRV